MGFIAALILVFTVFLTLVFLIGYLLSVRGYKGPITDHFDGQRFINPSGTPANGLREVQRYISTRQPDQWPDTRKSFVSDHPIASLAADGVQYTFINHSTFLIQINGLNILTDPIWSYRCSPFQFAGPHRWRPPGVQFENLPKIDLVLLTHNHYDHMDAPTLKRIFKKWDPQVIVPLGLAAQVKKYGATQITELDWWQQIQLHGLEITTTPANHFSSRGLFDRDKTLWCGFHLKTTAGLSIYYAGDTGYSPIFQEIGQRLGPMDLSFIPIGAYLPVWFMSPIHVSPLQAIQVHQDVRSQHSVAMHFGTFPLADDNPERSKSVLTAGLQTAKIPADKFVIPIEGETVLHTQPERFKT